MDWPDPLSALRALAPDGLCCAGGEITGHAPPLHAAEAAAIAGAVPKRQREFAAGRHFARLAMAELGFAALSLPVSASRAPVWPPLLVGSIAHTDTWCAAAVGRRDAFVGVGLDAEPAVPLPGGVADLVCSPAELSRLPTGPGREILPTWVFAAKEAVYKLYHPRVGTFLEFFDVQLTLDLAGEAFVAELRPGVPAFEGSRRLTGRIRSASGLILALATWPA